MYDLQLAEEAVLRRLSLDRSSSRFRRLVAGIQWNGRMVYWLHAVLIDGLPPLMLAIYFEILQTLRSKVSQKKWDFGVIIQWDSCHGIHI